MKTSSYSQKAAWGFLMLLSLTFIGCTDKKESQKELPKESFSETVNGVTFQMVYVEGDTQDALKEKGFFIGETEVTQELWEAVTGSNPSNFKGKDNPVEYVNWNEAQAFIAKLNELTGKEYRLPTEAEWEFAARGGNKSEGYEYSGSNNIDEVAWCWNNCDQKTHPVKTKAPNELGLYDMSGNVGEWCEDLVLLDTLQTRVVCGGSWWMDDVDECRVSGENCTFPENNDNNIGLRLAL